MTTYLNKILVKKTKVQAIIENEVSEWQNQKEAFNEILLKSLILGASANSLKQVSRAGVTDKEFEAVKKAQEQFKDIIYELEKELTIVLDNTNCSTHKFY